MSIQFRGPIAPEPRRVSAISSSRVPQQPNPSSAMPGGIDRFLFPQRIFEFLRDVRRQGIVQALFRPDSDENSTSTPSPAGLAGVLAGGSLVLGAVLDPELFERTKRLVLSDDPQHLRHLENHYNSTGNPNTLRLLAAIATSREATPERTAEILNFCRGALNDCGHPLGGIGASTPPPNDIFEGLDLSFLRAQVESNRDVFLSAVSGDPDWNLASHSDALRKMLREANFQSFREQTFDPTVGRELLQMAYLYRNESAREILRNIDSERVIQEATAFRNLTLEEIWQYTGPRGLYLNPDNLYKLADLGNSAAQWLTILNSSLLKEGASRVHTLKLMATYLDLRLSGAWYGMAFPGFEDWSTFPESERIPILREALSEWHSLSSTDRQPFNQERGFLTFLESRLQGSSAGSLGRPATEDLRREDDPTRGPDRPGRGGRGR